MGRLTKRKRTSRENGDTIFRGIERERDDATENIHKILVVLVMIRKELNESGEQIKQCQEEIVQKDIEINEIKRVISIKEKELEQNEQQKSWMTAQHRKLMKENEKKVEKLQKLNAPAEKKRTTNAVSSLRSFNLLDRKTKVARCERVIEYISQLVGSSNLDYFLRFFSKYINDAVKFTTRYRLSADETYYAKVRFNLSDGFFKIFKKFLTHVTGFDILASRHDLAKIQKEYSAKTYYECQAQEISVKCANGKEFKMKKPIVKIRDLYTVLSNRLSILTANNKLIYDDGTGDMIIIAIGADKGADETKLMLLVENVNKPNDSHGLLLLGFYCGGDDHESLRSNFSSIFDQINSLDSISFLSGDTVVTKLVKKKIIGDIKYISSNYEHPGQSFKNPSYKCDIEYSNHGKNKAVLANAVFNEAGNLLSLVDYQRNGDPLIQVEPCDATIPPFHCVTGILQKYGIDFFIEETNRIDGGKSLPGTLQEQNKALRTLELEEEIYVKRIAEQMKLKESLLEIQEGLNKFEKKSQKAGISIKCDSTCCLINTMKTKIMKDNNMYECEQCANLQHGVCAGWVNTEGKGCDSRSSCFECELGSPFTIDERKGEIFERIQKIDKNMQEDEETWSDINGEKTALEKILKESEGEMRKKFEEIMRIIKCESYACSKNLTGNMCRRFLRHENIVSVMDLFIKHDAYRNDQAGLDRLHHVKNFLFNLSELMSFADNSVKSDEDIDGIERVIADMILSLRKAHPGKGVIMKLHLLTAHLVPWLRIHHTWGRTSEQGLENVHSVFKKLHLTLAPMRDPIAKGYSIVQCYTNFNVLFDHGEWWIE